MTTASDSKSDQQAVQDRPGPPPDAPADHAQNQHEASETASDASDFEKLLLAHDEAVEQNLTSSANASAKSIKAQSMRS